MRLLWTGRCCSSLGGSPLSPQPAASRPALIARQRPRRRVLLPLRHRRHVFRPRPPAAHNQRAAAAVWARHRRARGPDVKSSATALQGSIHRNPAGQRQWQTRAERSVSGRGAGDPETGAAHKVARGARVVASHGHLRPCCDPPTGHEACRMRGTHSRGSYTSHDTPCKTLTASRHSFRLWPPCSTASATPTRPPRRPEALSCGCWNAPYISHPTARHDTYYPLCCSPSAVS